MSLDVHQMVRSGDMEDSECILCGSCVDGCKFGVIRYAWNREKAPQGVPEPQSL
jgi:ferredoxin-type protein NapH